MSDVEDRLEEGDETLIDTPINPLSANEAHGLILGFCVGLHLGRLDAQRSVAALSVSALVGSGTSAIGSRTKAREPWYFVAALTAGYAAGKRLL